MVLNVGQIDEILVAKTMVEMTNTILSELLEEPEILDKPKYHLKGSELLRRYQVSIAVSDELKINPISWSIYTHVSCFLVCR